jgi:hypothetical protein
MRGTSLCAAVVTGLAVGVSAAAQGTPPGSLDAFLARVGAHVEEYYARAQSIVCLETVRVQALKPDLLSDGFPRRLEYELRVAWDPPDEPGTFPDPSVVRRLLSVGGHAPDPKDDDKCMDPPEVTPEPLSMLLPAHRAEYVFKAAGTGRTDGRDAVIIDFRSAEKGKPEVTWKGECVSVSLPGRAAGRLWVDAETDDVIRLDQRLTGQFDFRVPPEHALFGSAADMVIERSDSSIHYGTVTFTDPDETLMLPKSIEKLQVVRGAGVPRARITQTFSGYRRFLTDAHIVQ